jgi:hypothetical protein
MMPPARTEDTLNRSSSSGITPVSWLSGFRRPPTAASVTRPASTRAVPDGASFFLRWCFSTMYGS